MLLEKGYIQVYTGSGKGKTTAALGLCARCACAGGKVLIGQFLKGQEYSELKMCDCMDTIEMHQFGTVDFVYGKPSAEDIKRAGEGLAFMDKAVMSGEYDLVIMDEINCAMDLGLVSEEAVIELLKRKPENVEIVLTGRCCPEALIEIADLVTEMREIKHYYSKGVDARKGIEK